MNKITKKVLIEEYLNKNKTINKIAKKIGCSDSTIKRRLNQYNIKKSKKGKLNPNWKNGNWCEPHYCIICKTKQICYETWKNGSGKCGHCCRLGLFTGDKNPMFGSICYWRGKQRLEFSGKNHPFYGKKRPLISLRMKGKNNPFYGKHHSQEVLQLLRNQPLSHGKSGKYKGIWMRSSYELVYAKYLDSKNIKWKYESKTFDLGNMTYTPDFYLPKQDKYIEIKGYWRNDAKIKFNLFKKLYSHINIQVLYKSNLLQLGVQICK